MQLDLSLKIIYITTGLISIITLLIGLDFIRSGRKSPYFRIRQKRVGSGWRMIGASILFGGIAYFAMKYGSFTPALLPQPATITPVITVELTAAETQIISPAKANTAVPKFPTLENTSFPAIKITETNTGKPGIKSTPVTSLPTAKAVKSIFTATITRTPTITRTITITPTPSKTRTSWPSFTPSRTWTPRPTYPSSRTPTITVTRVDTLTPTITNTRAPTRTEPATLTFTPTRTASPTATITPVPTGTNTATNTLTPTSTFTVTATNTRAPTKVEISGTTVIHDAAGTSKPETVNTAVRVNVTVTSIFTPTIDQVMSSIPTITLTTGTIQSPSASITSSPAGTETSVPAANRTTSTKNLSQFILIFLILLVIIPVCYVIIKNNQPE